MNKSNQIKITALYCRLSQDDGGTGNPTAFKTRQELKLSNMRKRETELGSIFKRLYEDSVRGGVTIEQFQTLF